MICPVCYGRHWIIWHGQVLPCPECGGLGEWHCCEGLQEQPSSSSWACPKDSVPSPPAAATLSACPPPPTTQPPDSDAVQPPPLDRKTPDSVTPAAGAHEVRSREQV